MRYKVYSTDQPVPRRRRRIGEFTKEVKQYKATLSVWQNINREIRLSA